jgi:hypothetical protein
MYARGEPSMKQKILQNLFRGISFAIIPIAAQAPMVSNVFW